MFSQEVTSHGWELTFQLLVTAAALAVARLHHMHLLGSEDRDST